MFFCIYFNNHFAWPRGCTERLARSNFVMISVLVCLEKVMQDFNLVTVEDPCYSPFPDFTFSDTVF